MLLKASILTIITHHLCKRKFGFIYAMNAFHMTTKTTKNYMSSSLQQCSVHQSGWLSITTKTVACWQQQQQQQQQQPQPVFYIPAMLSEPIRMTLLSVVPNQLVQLIIVIVIISKLLTSNYYQQWFLQTMIQVLQILKYLSSWYWYCYYHQPL